MQTVGSCRKAGVDGEWASFSKLFIPDHVHRLDPVQSCRS